MGRLILYHGSSEIVKIPELNKGKIYNDYGKGFYCTKHIELAREWACTENHDGYVNQYKLETGDLKILNLSSENYTILHWLALLVENRRVRVSTPVMRRGVEWLANDFLLDISGFDVVIGYRADDSYFSFARAFLNNEISLQQLSYAMRLGELGEQFVLKSKKAFDMIRFLSCERVDNTLYYAKRKVRDEQARAAFIKEAEKEDLEGWYIRDMIREGVRADDPRIR